MKKTITLSILVTVLFSGCFGGKNNKEEWTSLIYPDKHNTKRSKKHGIYPTLKQCQEESKKELDKLDLSSKGDYQCGLNCNFHEGMKIDICEKLSK